MWNFRESHGNEIAFTAIFQELSYHETNRWSIRSTFTKGFQRNIPRRKGMAHSSNRKPIFVSDAANFQHIFSLYIYVSYRHKRSRDIAYNSINTYRFFSGCFYAVFEAFSKHTFRPLLRCTLSLQVTVLQWLRACSSLFNPDILISVSE